MENTKVRVCTATWNLIDLYQVGSNPLPDMIAVYVFEIGKFVFLVTVMSDGDFNWSVFKVTAMM